MTTLEPPYSGLVLYAELDAAQIRQAQRYLALGKLKRIAPGVLTSVDPEDWPSVVARERIRILAALFPESVIGPHNAFIGGMPVDSVMYLEYKYNRTVELPGLTVRLQKGYGPIFGDTPMMGRPIYFPSEARVLLENLATSRTPKSGPPEKTVEPTEVEKRLIAICEARGEQALGKLRDQARLVAQTLGLERPMDKLDQLIGTILGTRHSPMSTPTGKGLAAAPPYDANRLDVIENLAATLRSRPLPNQACPVKSQAGRTNFAFLESYFSNFIEGTEFEVQEAREFVLEGKSETQRYADAQDLIKTFNQANTSRLGKSDNELG